MRPDPKYVYSEISVAQLERCAKGRRFWESLWEITERDPLTGLEANPTTHSTTNMDDIRLC